MIAALFLDTTPSRPTGDANTMKNLAKLALATIALTATACDPYVLVSGGYNDGQIAPPPQSCSEKTDAGTQTILSCTKPHQSTLNGN